MAHVHQAIGWLEWTREFQEHPAWSTVDPDGRWFIEAFQGLLMNMPTNVRANISTPFTKAFKKLVEHRGINVDACCTEVEVVPGLTKTADVSFSVGDEQWIVEIKQNLDFSSLASAALQGACYKARHSEHKHMLLCLYAKQIRGDVMGALSVAGLSHAFDHVFVLTRNKLEGNEWHEDFAKQLNALVSALPGRSAVA